MLSAAIVARRVETHATRAPLVRVAVTYSDSGFRLPPVTCRCSAVGVLVALLVSACLMVGQVDLLVEVELRVRLWLFGIC